MSLRHPLFHRTILALLLDIQESGYEPQHIKEAFVRFFDQDEN